jgi:hypothetical protein
VSAKILTIRGEIPLGTNSHQHMHKRSDSNKNVVI